MLDAMNKHFISPLFKTDKDRPIYFDENGYPYYGTKKGNYASAIQCGFPLYCEFEILDPDPVDTVIPKIEKKQIIPQKKIMDNDTLYEKISFRKKNTSTKKIKKDKRRLSEKRKYNKDKISKETFWEKQNTCLDPEMLTEPDPIEDPPEDYDTDYNYNTYDYDSEDFDDTDYFDRWEHRYYF